MTVCDIVELFIIDLLNTFNVVVSVANIQNLIFG